MPRKKNSHVMCCAAPNYSDLILGTFPEAVSQRCVYVQRGITDVQSKQLSNAVSSTGLTRPSRLFRDENKAEITKLHDLDHYRTLKVYLTDGQTIESLEDLPVYSKVTNRSMYCCHCF